MKLTHRCTNGSGPVYTNGSLRCRLPGRDRIDKPSFCFSDELSRVKLRVYRGPFRRTVVIPILDKESRFRAGWERTTVRPYGITPDFHATFKQTWYKTNFGTARRIEWRLI